MRISKNRFDTFMTYLFILCSSWLTSPAWSQKIDTLPAKDVLKIWDQAPYNAFTDFIRFKGAFYCTFREGKTHVSPGDNGVARVLKSNDGIHWKSQARISLPGLDLRDPKISITRDSLLMIVMAASDLRESERERILYPVVSFSNKEGNDFSVPRKILLDPDIRPNQDWLWRVTWHSGKGYGINYHLNHPLKDGTDKTTAYLMSSGNGVDFKLLYPFRMKGFPNESTIRFDTEGKMYVLIRNDGNGGKGILAVAEPPYKEWKFTHLDYALGGPDFLFLNKIRLVIGTRDYEENKGGTVIFITDLKGKVLRKILLPSGGKGGSSYPGMLIYNQELWVSYYSGHEGNTSIYLARIPLKDLTI